ncbi:hypothetical protein ACIREO_00295 [Streptomyces sp. NPDC102441]|uniref:hypothetical protein n=1 Tax=Streptomyces sp. NPDC102441 TaxID=3366176 RepID=UPI00381E6952
MRWRERRQRQGRGREGPSPLTVLRSGSTTLAFRGEILGTQDIGGIPADVMAAQ